MVKDLLAIVGAITIFFMVAITTWYCIFDKMPEESKGEEKDGNNK